MELLERFAAGDLDAFETLFRQHQGEVVRWIMRIVRNEAAAEDLTVETFWRIYRGRARFDPRRSFTAWTRRIATNAALDHLRTARVEVELPDDLPEPPRADPAVQEETRRRVREAFQRLSPKLRLAAVLALVEERPYAEIAEALGASVAAVKVRVFRAIRQLRKTLSEMGIQA